MNLDETTTQALSQLQAQVSGLTGLCVALVILVVLLLGVSGVTLWFVLRTLRRDRKVEDWLARELALLRPDTASAQPPVSDLPAAKPPRVVRVSRQRTPQAPPKPINLLLTINEMIAGEQPYNFIDAASTLDATLVLQRLTPTTNDDVFAQDTLLEAGGDGLFAAVYGEDAELYPNYGRFSATLDPAPLFDGARHGGRIYAVIQPALLKRQPNVAWLLTRRGRVKMRQEGTS